MLAVCALLLILAHSTAKRRNVEGSPPLVVALAILTFVVAAVAGYYMFKAGQSGSASVWSAPRVGAVERDI